MESWSCEPGRAARIVVGVDGSPASVPGLRWAAQEAARAGACLHVITARDDAASFRAPYAGVSGTAWPENQRAATAARLTDCIRAALGPAPVVPVRAEVIDGPAEQVLLTAADGAHLLVIGSAPRSSRFAARAGAVHRACLRGAPCPVVVVGAAARWPGNGHAARKRAADLATR